MSLTRRQLLRSAASVAALAAVPTLAAQRLDYPVMFVSTGKREIREFSYDLETDGELVRVVDPSGYFDGGDMPMKPGDVVHVTGPGGVFQVWRL